MNFIEKILRTSDYSKSFNSKDINDGKMLSILAYLIPPIPYFLEKRNRYVQFHARCGMDLMIISFIYLILYSFLTSVIKVKTSCGFFIPYDIGNYCSKTPLWVTLPLTLIWLFLGFVAIFGIFNAVKGMARELPIIEKYKIFKK